MTDEDAYRAEIYGLRPLTITPARRTLIEGADMTDETPAPRDDTTERVCRSRTCGRTFVPTQPTHLYCCQPCKKAEMMRRRRRNRVAT